MSTEVQHVLVKDKRLCLSEQLAYSVYKGGQNVTVQKYPAIGATPSSVVFNCQLPSLETIIDRCVLVRATIQLKCVVSGTNVGAFKIDYGMGDALAPFPLHQLMNTLTATLNSNTVSVNMREVLPAYCKLLSKRELADYNGFCPTMADNYGLYADGYNTHNNVLGSYVNSEHDLYPRGSFVLDSVSATVNAAKGTFDLAAVTAPNAADPFYITFTTTEPLMISPFIFANPQYNSQGMFGLTNMSINMNLGDCSRIWRTAGAGSTANPHTFDSMVIQSINEATLILTQLTGHPSDNLMSKNCVPYVDLPRFLTSNLGTFDPANSGGAIVWRDVESSNIQLNQIPDSMIIYVTSAIKDNTDTDWALAIRNISVNFNNASGLMSAFTQQDLYKISVENGMHQSWEEFSGFCNVRKSAYSTATSDVKPALGSYLKINFGKDLQLVEDWFAPGSLGNFNLQFKLTVGNQFDSPVVNPQIVLICQNSGVWVNERGTSSVYTGILTKSNVIDTSRQTPQNEGHLKRMIGGSFLDSLRSVLGTVGPISRQIGSVLNTVGFGASGGGSSGGGASGGLRNRLH